MVIAIISVLAAVFLVLYVCKSQDYKGLEKDNKWLREQREGKLQSMIADNMDLRPLDKETAMEAIRYNGFVPEMEGTWINFLHHGECYLIDTERFPVLVLMKHYNLDHSKWDMDLMHKAAHQVSDEYIMAKVLFTGEQEDGIALQITAIENKYGHFKDCLLRYIKIVEGAHERMITLYNEMYAQRKENLSIIPQLGAEASGEKKILS